MDSLTCEIRASLAAIENQPALFVETNFSARAAALDFLEVAIDRIEGLLLANGESEPLQSLQQHAASVRTRLEAVDERLFRRLRQEIGSADYTGTQWKQRLAEYAGPVASAGYAAEDGYDALDALVNGILLEEAAPESSETLEPQMIFYQPTPARVVLEMVDRLDFGPDDTFYDIGSGLGQVAILVHLLTGMRASGVEIEPAYCAYARRCASRLGLSAVEFIAGDARATDFADGNIFFLYTPFVGAILEQVLERLRHVSTQHRIRLCTFGPCTPQVARHEWLTPSKKTSNWTDRMTLFSSGEEDK